MPPPINYKKIGGGTGHLVESTKLLRSVAVNGLLVSVVAWPDRSCHDTEMDIMWLESSRV